MSKPLAVSPHNCRRPSLSKEPMKLAVSNVTLRSNGKLWQMAPKTVDATIMVDQTPGVAVEEQRLTSVPDSMMVPPFSVNIYSFPIQ